MYGAGECPTRLRDAREAFDRAMHAANVTIHVFDPVGLDSGLDSPLGEARVRERLDSLPIMADMTGGRTVLATNAPETQVASILQESSVYYVIGFSPASAASDRSHRIDIRVKPRGLSVRARNEYRLSDAPASANQPATALTRAVSDVLPNGDVPLELSAVPMIARERSAALLVGRIAAGIARPTALLSAAFTRRAAPVVSRRIAIRPMTGGAVDAGALGLVSALALEPGAYEIRVAAELPGGATGSVHTFVDIPDFKRAPLSMSGILLHVSPEETSVPRDEIDGALPFVPTAKRTFAATDTVSAFVQVSQGTTRSNALQPVTLKLRVDDARAAGVRAQTSALAPAQFATNRTAQSRLSLPLRDLPHGHYLLTLEATQGTLRTERQLRFEIR
jgi:hypothetical protein